MPVSDTVDRNEFRRQLKLQESALNRMTPSVMLVNREDYFANREGMRRLSEPLQEATRAEYYASLEPEYQRAYGPRWKTQLDTHMTTVAALHNPDMIAGGAYTSVADRSTPLRGRIGGVNDDSSMGSQWRGGRSQKLTNHAIRQERNGCRSVQGVLEDCVDPGRYGRKTMPEYTDEDWYDDLVYSYAPPAFPTYPTEQQLAKWRGRVPDLMMRWWREQGWGSLSNGQYWVCDPDQLRPVMEEVFAGDPDYREDELVPIGYDALGKIDVALGQGRSMTIDPVFGIASTRGPQPQFPQSDFLGVYYSRVATGAHRWDRNDEAMIPTFHCALQNLGELGPGEIYGFVPAYALAGDSPVKNLQKLPLVEHLVMLASLSPRTLYDYVLPEGGQGGFGDLVPRRKLGRQS